MWIFIFFATNSVLQEPKNKLGKRINLEFMAQRLRNLSFLSTNLTPRYSALQSERCIKSVWNGFTSHPQYTVAASVFDVQNSKPYSEIPGPRGLPYIGNLLPYRFGYFKITGRPENLLFKYNKYGPIVKETILDETIVHLFDPDFIKIVYQTDTKTPHIPSLMAAVRDYRAKRNLSPGLGNLNGDHWYRLRGAVQQLMMRPKSVEVFLPMVLEVANDFLEYVTPRRDSNFEIPDFLNKATVWNLESAAYKCFGKRLHGINDDTSSVSQKMVDSNAKVFEIATMLKYRLPLYKKLYSPMWNKMVESEDYFMNRGTEFMDEALTQIQKSISKAGAAEDRHKFLTYLLGRDELEYKDMHILTMSLFNDGLRTTAPALIFVLYLLAKNQDTQQKLYDEIMQVLPGDTPITIEAINQIKFLRCCIKEMFRLFPIGIEVSRVLQKDLVIGGYHLPEGTRVDINQSVMLKSDKYFEEPEKYNPERWMRDGTAHGIHPFILTPFGHGARMCIGRRFSEQELNVLIIMFLKRFRVDWHQDYEISHEYYILEHPDKPAKIAFYDRN